MRTFVVDLQNFFCWIAVLKEGSLGRPELEDRRQTARLNLVVSAPSTPVPVIITQRNSERQRLPSH